jgi:hypothetical protein
MYYTEEIYFAYHSQVSLIDELGRDIQYNLKAVAIKGMGHENDQQEWINYRRNHIQLDARFEMDLYSNHLFVKQDHGHYCEVEEPIVGMGKSSERISFEYVQDCCQSHQITKLFLNCNVISIVNKDIKLTEKFPTVGMLQLSSKRDVALQLVDVQLVDFKKETSQPRV